MSCLLFDHLPEECRLRMQYYETSSLQAIASATFELDDF